ncbi:RAMP superfamily CRISPR-associated protein [Pseudofrankia sp. BMG5.37]|uniref:RAMP superfamily CRISPR-associated protein n=1 Tax=Pseudofrankia sp. BMG5.37 TaxID=3050035 RepID=UPI002893C882|nr:RAMP superfamily CRISPR-associated protein [Pseudofrankia sp. BMG5.37]MDT3440481.1 RAMP superfamily CRISPR-associated protein [Pseudofrankia sp. BMG5.37]
MTAQKAPHAAGPAPLSTSAAVPYQITMLSDWHAGTGTGRPGDVDRLVARDDDGLPYLPAKTVTGLWRDGCEIAARALDAAADVDDNDTSGDKTAAGDGASVPGGSWSRLVGQLFGGQPGLRPRERRGASPAERPEPAALSIRAARLDDDLRTALAQLPRVKDAVTFVKPGVKIEIRSGRAEDRKLRFEEQARAGAWLTGVLTLRAPADDVDGDEFRRYATALLLAGARLVEQIGGKRRRGNGRCDLTIPTQSALLDQWWTWLDAAPAPPVERWAMPPVGPRGRSLFAGTAPDDAGSPAEAWEIAELTLTLVDPVLAGGRLIGNQLKGANQIPGGTLLPKVLAELGPRAQAAMLAGRLLVTAATPVVAGQRALLAPRVLNRVKADLEEARVVNRTLALAPPAKRGEAGQRLQLTQISGFVGPDLVTMTLRDDVSSGCAERPFVLCPTPTTEIRTHNSVDDASQRPTTDAGGGLFTYEVMTPGTLLRAEVRVRAGELADGWQERLRGDWTLGRSRKDDYGRVSVSVARLPSPRAASRAAAAGARRLLVWLLSDVILLDERLRASTRPDLLRAAIERSLGLAPAQLRDTEPRQPRPDADDEEDEHWLVPVDLTPGRTESWHSRWGLPRPTISAIAAGGVVSYDLVRTAVLDLDGLVRLETGGIGERRAEGFGQVRVAIVPDDDGNGAGPDGPTVLTVCEGPRALAWGADPARFPSDAEATGTVPPAAVLTGAGRDLFGALCAEAWRSEIARRAVALGADLPRHDDIFGPGVNRVTPSQLALLRDLLPELTAAESVDDEAGDPAGGRPTVESLFAEIVDQARGRAWPAKVGEFTSLLLTSPDRVWELLGWSDVLAETRERLPPGDALPGALLSRLWPEAVGALVLAALSARRRRS